MKESVRKGWKAYIGSGLVLTGSAIAGYGFGKKDNRMTLIGTYMMGLGTLCILDTHADTINNLNARVINLENENR